MTAPTWRGLCSEAGAAMSASNSQYVYTAVKEGLLKAVADSFTRPVTATEEILDMGARKSFRYSSCAPASPLTPRWPHPDPELTLAEVDTSERRILLSQNMLRHDELLVSSSDVNALGMSQAGGCEAD